ncbi:CLUMA_CG006851, isoform A [Clunio marinus]|uniref:CLUMA_CG006851, isoform A n=1 Tax=Clunio marinus TaxID=568069 RepID=A0A1J1I144_9DIPT|nr:CLUMA_CG006851, isoform A [Clunio marinus]
MSPDNGNPKTRFLPFSLASYLLLVTIMCLLSDNDKSSINIGISLSDSDLFSLKKLIKLKGNEKYQFLNFTTQ